MRGLYAIADPSFNPYPTIPKLALQLLRGGAPIIQLRMKHGGEGHEHHVRETAREIMRFKKDFTFTFIVNDYVDVAVEIGADGVHIGKGDMPLEKVRACVPAGTIVGYSSHSLEEAREAQAAGADYVAFGAIYPTKTKGPGHPVQGIAMLKRVVAALDVPVVAIGGIGRENIAEVMGTGAATVAMITALSDAPSVSAETRWFVDRINKI